jgi:protein-S-isoprenylcysteine O-methyltransferase Ste14
VKLIVKNALFTVMVPGTVGLYVPLLLTRGLAPAASGARLLALPLFAVALSVYLWSVWNFGSRGKATPLPIDAPKRLAVEGPYLHTRNPMYLAVMSALLGWLLVYQSLGLLLYTIGVGSAFASFVIWYEEPHLRRQFGEQYDQYRARVPRWLPRRSRPPDG